MKGKILIGFIFLFTACLPDYETAQERLEKDIRKIDNYLAENGIIAIKDASGVRVVLHQLGTAGLPPNTGNDIRVDYTGKLFSNGDVFDDGVITGRLTDFILGWELGLSLLPEGSIATLYIPSGYAYGPAGTVNIPGNAILVFDVELESVSNTATQNQRLAADTVAIDDYLADNSIAAIKDKSGLRYVITEQGTGAIPTWYDKIRVKYTGKLMSDGTVFATGINEQSKNFDSRLINYIHGFQIGLQQLQKGGKATLYIPSGLAYGTTTTTQVPANSNLIFDVELLDVVPQ